jgi:hypothetical protein
LGRKAGTREGVNIKLEDLPEQELNFTIEAAMVCIGALEQELMEFRWQAKGQALCVRHDIIMTSY